MAVLPAITLAGAGAQTPAPAPPEDPIAAKAYAVLDQHCARCHQSGRVQGHPPVADFGNILDLEALARDQSLLRPGNPDGSRLYTMMLSRAMPFDIYHEGRAGEAPLARDLDAVRMWIQGLKPAEACRDVDPGGAEAERAQMSRALDALPPERRPQTRFVTLTHLQNACVDGARMAGYRHAIGQLLNALSWGLAPARLETVDPGQTILRVDLGAIRWSAETWERLTSSYPYVGAETAESEALRRATGAAIPAVRGDWLAFAASRAPLYYHLLGIPDRSRILATSLRVDLDADSATTQVRRAAIRSSAVGQGVRLIERFPFANGAYWRTLEFVAGDNRAAPFDAAAIAAGRTTGKADASLTMFSLPNGFSAFLITNGDGQRINEAPATVVRDPAHRLARVTAGISCLGCHGRGARSVTDELRPLVAAAGAAGREVKERVAQHYPEPAAFERLVREDNERIEAAFAAAGLDPAAALDGVAPIAALSARYERRVGVAVAAAELAVPRAELTGLAARLKGEELRVLRRLLHGTISRRELEVHYAAFAAALAGSQAAPGAASSTPHPGLADDAESIELALTTDRTSYQPGDLISILARPSTGCYLTLVNIDQKGRGTVLFPNEFEQSNYIEAGREVQVPGASAPYQFRTRERGHETLVGICSPTQKIADGIKPDYERQRFTELGDYRAFLNRTFDAESEDRRAVARARPGAPKGREAGAVKAVQLRRAGGGQARIAIQVEVR